MRILTVTQITAVEVLKI